MLGTLDIDHLAPGTSEYSPEGPVASGTGWRWRGLASTVVAFIAHVDCIE